MNKLVGFCAFSILCIPMSVFGQFHTISQQSKLYNIERTSERPGLVPGIITANETLLSKKPADKDETAPIPVQSPSDSLRQQYINRYLSVSFPLKHLIINSPFGQRKDPFTGKKRSHNGLDLRASGDEVYAMLDGIVKKTGEDKRSGKYVILQHGEYLVSYCHLSRIRIERGIHVKPGEIVGITGSTGRSTGEHLHITCKFDGKNIDPLLLIDYIKTIKKECVGALAKL